MPIQDSIQKSVRDYVEAHLADEDWHRDYFDFIRDSDLANRLGEEFISIRYIYKLLESISADDWLLRAQVRIQVLSYASIYEAVVHHILFDVMKENTLVKELTQRQVKKKISIPGDKMEALKKHLNHSGREIIPTYNDIDTIDERLIRFDKKVECAFALGFIDDSMQADLKKIYEARNSIHIHAEIRNGTEYELDLARISYRRLKPFKEQVTKNLSMIISL